MMPWDEDEEKRPAYVRRGDNHHHRARRREEEAFRGRPSSFDDYYSEERDERRLSQRPEIPEFEGESPEDEESAEKPEQPECQPEVDEQLPKIKTLKFEGIHGVPSDATSGEPIAFLKCTLERTKTLWGPELKLLLGDSGEPLLVARKRQRSGNYHIYDVSQGTLGRKLTKKGGNYLGKIAAAAPNEPHQRVLLDNSSGDKRKEIALFVHRKTRTLSALVDGAKPRQICVVLPGDSVQKNLLGRFLVSDRDLTVLNQRQPRLVNGQYSLNFYGRATVASVKNCQLVVEGQKNIALQLGKVSTDMFNLDFAAPFTPLVAFALAVSQFIC